MPDTPDRRDPQRPEEKAGEPRRRERPDPGEAEWVLERIQQTFDIPRE